MKKYIGLTAIIVTMSFALMACSDNSDASNESINSDNISEKSNNENSQQQNEDNEESLNNGNEKTDDDKKWGEDELGLSIGDTGVNRSTIGKAEITLDSAEMIDENELEEDTNVTQLIAVHVTVKNIGEEPFDPEDVLYSGELGEPGTDYGSMWDYYDGVSEEWQEKLEVDEKTSGIMVFDANKMDEYKLVIGNILSKVSNQVSFEFSKDEMN